MVDGLPPPLRRHSHGWVGHSAESCRFPPNIARIIDQSVDPSQSD
jgi:hypothetical protein